MAKTKRIFISDIHLSSQERYNAAEKMKRARFSPPKHKARLVNFLNKSILEKENEIKDLVLAGDLAVSFLNCFEVFAQDTDTFTLLAAGESLTGEFDNVAQAMPFSIFIASNGAILGKHYSELDAGHLEIVATTIESLESGAIGLDQARARLEDLH